MNTGVMTKIETIPNTTQCHQMVWVTRFTAYERNSPNAVTADIQVSQTGTAIDEQENIPSRVMATALTRFIYWGELMPSSGPGQQR
jgi:hypothetical protein